MTLQKLTMLQVFTLLQVLKTIQIHMTLQISTYSVASTCEVASTYDVTGSKYLQRMQIHMMLQIFTTLLQCVTRPKIWTIPIPRLFFGTNIFRDRFRDFFGTKFFQNRFQDFFGFEFFLDQFRPFFQYQIFSIQIPRLFWYIKNCTPVPRLFLVSNFYQDPFRYHKKGKNPGNGTILRPRPKPMPKFLRQRQHNSRLILGLLATKFVLLPIRRFFGTKFFWDWYRKIFGTDSETFFGINFF